MCFFISSFATQMCLHNVYANIMYAFCTATPTDIEQVITSRTDVLNGHTTALEDKMEGCGEKFRNAKCCLQQMKAAH